MSNTLFKGYPYGEPKSQEIFPSSDRPTGQQIEARAKEGLGVSSELLQLYSRALHEAEQQVRDLQLDYPFLPEDYGFEQLESNGFTLKYKSGAGNVSIERITDVSWRLRASYREFENADNVTVEEKSPIDLIVTIRNEKEAYMAFKLLGLTKYIKTKSDAIPEGDLVDSRDIIFTHPELQAEEEEQNNEPTTDITPETHVSADTETQNNN